MIPNEHILRALAGQLPARIGAARHNGLDCIRLTLVEAQAIRSLIPRELADIDAAVVGARKGTR